MAHGPPGVLAPAPAWFTVPARGADTARPRPTRPEHGTSFPPGATGGHRGRTSGDTPCNKSPILVVRRDCTSTSAIAIPACGNRGRSRRAWAGRVGPCTGSAPTPDTQPCPKPAGPCRPPHHLRRRHHHLILVVRRGSTSTSATAAPACGNRGRSRRAWAGRVGPCTGSAPTPDTQPCPRPAQLRHPLPRRRHRHLILVVRRGSTSTSATAAPACGNQDRSRRAWAGRVGPCTGSAPTPDTQPCPRPAQLRHPLPRHHLPLPAHICRRPLRHPLPPPVRICRRPLRHPLPLLVRICRRPLRPRLPLLVHTCRRPRRRRTRRRSARRGGPTKPGRRCGNGCGGSRLFPTPAASPTITTRRFPVGNCS